MPEGAFLAEVVSPTVSLRTLSTAWQHDWLSILGLIVEAALACCYLWGVRRLAVRGRHWATLRTVSFLGGLALVAIALQSGLASYDDSVFEMHVVQHLLLMSFAPILLVLGAPVTLALQASNRRAQRTILKAIHHPAVEAVTNPVLVASVAYVTMIVYFLTPFYAFSLQHPVVHELTHLHFLVAGYLFWWLVVGVDASRWRLSYPAKIGLLAAGIPVTAILGVALTSARTSIAPQFHSVADTRAGGSVLWIVGELVTLVAIGIIVYQWMSYEEREAARSDRRLDAEAAGSAATGQAEYQRRTADLLDPH